MYTHTHVCVFSHRSCTNQIHDVTPTSTVRIWLVLHHIHCDWLPPPHLRGPTAGIKKTRTGQRTYSPVQAFKVTIHAQLFVTTIADGRRCALPSQRGSMGGLLLLGRSSLICTLKKNVKETDCGNGEWLISIEVNLWVACDSPINFIEISFPQYLSLFLILGPINLIGALSHLTPVKFLKCPIPSPNLRSFKCLNHYILSYLSVFFHYDGFASSSYSSLSRLKITNHTGLSTQIPPYLQWSNS